ncbi:MAG TPA: RagB/SusD family nutrient uptake outer membrane protein [Thermoanaerobaculia bacterium]|nr:RagB/SusD family nutrient uptake outer membrane protein [Thermoanaerobaculia bacterium]
MTINSMSRSLATVVVLGALVATGCDFNITNPNTPTQIGPNPSAEQVAAAVTGVLIATRGGVGGTILREGIMGREGYRIDASEPRYVSELLHGPLDPGGFGGGQWSGQYTALRSAYNLLNVLGTAQQLTAAEQDGARGVVQTMQAFAYTEILEAHTEDSIPIDVNRPITDPPAPFVTNAAAWNHVVSLLDSARTALAAAGGSFAFALPAGFAGFNTPATFLEFNRALMARVQAYRGSLGCTACYDSALTALAASFVDSTRSMDLGVYFDFSTASGDAVNGLSQDPASAIQLVHPSIRDSVELKPDSTRDSRYLAKVTDRGSALGDSTHSSDLSWIRYPTPSSPIPIIRNEELLLLRAEANNGATARNAVAAAADLNTVRVKSGGLAALVGVPALAADSVVGLLLRERKYSLLYEGHRWVDMRRFGRLADVIIDAGSGDQVFSTLPIPLAETLARQ